MPSELDEKVSFMLQIPFFSHWFKKKVRNLMQGSRTIKVNRGKFLQHEGTTNDFVYIIRSGKFQASKKFKTDIPAQAEHERIREFLQGTQAKRSVRGIFNSKINRITNKSGLTQKMIHVGDEDITVLEQGQLFGEGRFIEIYNRQLREQQKQAQQKDLPVQRQSSKKEVRIPTEFEDDSSSKAPYSVRCVSQTGEVWRISGLDFFRYVLKDKNTIAQLSKNIRDRFNTIKVNEGNRHEEFKFHNVQGKEYDSVLDPESDHYISDDEEEVKEQQRPERMILKDMLVEPGTDYRDQLAEIVKGFPKVRKAMNLNDSVSDWADSQGNPAELLDHDDQAFAKTENAILKSYQTYLQSKHGEPQYANQGHQIVPSTLKTKNDAVKGMAEMARHSFAATQREMFSPQASTHVKLLDAKDYVKNSFKGAQTPSVEQVAKQKSKSNTVEKSAYTSSSILNAYKYFKLIEKRTEIEKKKRIFEETRKKEEAVITDATNFRKTINNIDTESLVPRKPSYSLIGQSKRDLLKQEKAAVESRRSSPLRPQSSHLTSPAAVPLGQEINVNSALSIHMSDSKRVRTAVQSRHGRNSIQPTSNTFTVNQHQRSISSNEDGGDPGLQRLKKTTFLESAVYNPNNYLYNTNYNREFEDKIRSEGANFIQSLARNRQGGPTKPVHNIQSGTVQISSFATIDPDALVEAKRQEIQQKQMARTIELRKNTHNLRMRSQAFRNYQQVGSSNFNSSSMAHRDHCLSTSPSRKRSVPSQTNAQFFEHLKGKQGAESVQTKQPMSRQTIQAFSQTMSQFNARSARPASSTIHSKNRRGMRNNTSTMNTGVTSLVQSNHKFMPQAQTLRLRAKSGINVFSTPKSRIGVGMQYTRTPVSLF